jgi:predicted nuclease of predicted toxin-antitoxin system
MKLIIDAQLSPHLALWINQVFKIETFSVKFLGLRDASDIEIWEEARKLNAVVLTKDNDFVNLLSLRGSPPKIIWITCGNTSNQRMKEVLTQHLTNALSMLKETELVEISD